MWQVKPGCGRVRESEPVTTYISRQTKIRYICASVLTKKCAYEYEVVVVIVLCFLSLQKWRFKHHFNDCLKCISVLTNLHNTIPKVSTYILGLTVYPSSLNHWHSTTEYLQIAVSSSYIKSLNSVTLGKQLKIYPSLKENTNNNNDRKTNKKKT